MRKISKPGKNRKKGSLPPASYGPEIEFEFIPPGRSRGDVEALSFAEYIAALIRALRQTASFIAGEKVGIRYDVVGLTLNSPARVLVRGMTRHEDGAALLHRTDIAFVHNIQAVQHGAPIPFASVALLKSYKRVGDVARRTRMVAAVRPAGAGSVEVKPLLSDRLALVLEDDTHAPGSVEGYLEVLNVHGRPVIKIYPVIGPPISGRLPRRLVPMAKQHVDEYVRVKGTLVYAAKAMQPYRIHVEGIEPIHRREEGPNFDDIWGIGASYEPQKSSVDLIEEMRSGWE